MLNIKKKHNLSLLTVTVFTPVPEWNKGKAYSPHNVWILLFCLL